MNERAETIEFKPPRAGRWQGPVGLAVVVHVLLIAALTWGVSWKQDATPTFEAELWSMNAQQAAPRAVEPPPPPPRPPAPEPRPEPPPPSPRPTPEPSKRAPDIATEQAKQKEQERKAAQEKARQEEARKKKAEDERKERERQQAEDRKKKQQEAERRRQEDKRKAEAKRKAAEERRLAEAQKAAREEQMRRIQGLAGATGGPNATGTALRSSGPSSGYAGRVAAAIKPNIIYSEDFPASLRTEVEVRARPDGRITARRVVRSSGNRSWDNAALRAIDRTASLPRDTDGRVPSPIVIVVRPTD